MGEKTMPFVLALCLLASACVSPSAPPAVIHTMADGKVTFAHAAPEWREDRIVLTWLEAEGVGGVAMTKIEVNVALAESGPYERGVGASRLRPSRGLQFGPLALPPGAEQAWLEVRVTTDAGVVEQRFPVRR